MCDYNRDDQPKRQAPSLASDNSRDRERQAVSRCRPDLDRPPPLATPDRPHTARDPRERAEKDVLGHDNILPMPEHFYVSENGLFKYRGWNKPALQITLQPLSLIGAHLDDDRHPQLDFIFVPWRGEPARYFSLPLGRTGRPPRLPAFCKHGITILHPRALRQYLRDAWRILCLRPRRVS